LPKEALLMIDSSTALQLNNSQTRLTHQHVSNVFPSRVFVAFIIFPKLKRMRSLNYDFCPTISKQDMQSHIVKSKSSAHHRNRDEPSQLRVFEWLQGLMSFT
jgi:hypothetical protein